jgi:hypothetical protein
LLELVTAFCVAGFMVTGTLAKALVFGVRFDGFASFLASGLCFSSFDF